MSTPFIHLPAGTLGLPVVTLKNDDFYHLIKVLRYRRGEKVFLSDGCFLAESEIVEIEGNIAKLKVICREKISPLKPRISLFCSPLKGKRMEILLEKATEIGVDEIQPVLFKRTVVKPMRDNTQLRWHKIIKAAAEQAHQPRIPVLFPLLCWNEAREKLKDYPMVLAFLENEQKFSLKDVKLERADKVAVIVGPEGGFDGQEEKEFYASGFHCLTLGQQILRAETAAIVALTLVFYQMGRLA